MMTKRKSLKDRFWAKVDKKGPDECWEWIGAKNPDGYGEIRDGEAAKAHRMSWKLHNGPIPDGLWVLHHCDNPGCVNPDHLFLGDRQANMDDMRAKRRGIYPRGEDHGRAKLTGEKVHEIRALPALGELSQQTIGEMHGVGRTTIGKIHADENWAWLKEEEEHEDLSQNHS